MEDVKREAAAALFRNVNLQWETGVCDTPGMPPLGSGAARLFSTVPTLFISGTLDTNTTPAQAEDIRWGFPRSTHLVIENAGHESLPSPEVQEIVAAFLAGEDVSGRSVSFPPPRFIVDLPRSEGQP
jgi:pimeloyl-ACP methyl ester carboxylesterase